jgi:hypothetical protein
MAAEQMYAIDQLTLAIGLKSLDADTELVTERDQAIIELGESRRAVDLGLADPQQVQVGSV